MSGPQTPALHGIWDLDELYYLTDDPSENNNLLAQPGPEALAEWLSHKQMRVCATNCAVPAALLVKRSRANVVEPRLVLERPDHGAAAALPRWLLTIYP
ncbi:hypothetical protein [Novosphingobium sp.]|uniref:hypothetical protein n=1 Tax=Novosphingobium sp. TaxID=1874826 RepID=UPI0028A79283|nr:hypothetical protein [Novosphingobium sp.]